MDSTTKALILEGSHGHSFFMCEMLLGYRLIEEADLVSKVTEAIEFLDQRSDYDLIVIDLLDTWHQGLELGFWLLQHPQPCPIILIIPPDMTQLAPPFITLSAPLSLQDFAQAVRTSLKGTQNKHGETYDYS